MRQMRHQPEALPMTKQFFSRASGTHHHGHGQHVRDPHPHSIIIFATIPSRTSK